MKINESTVSGNKYKRVDHVSVRNIFVIACILGASAILFGIKFQSQIISITLPLLVMFLYIIIVTKLDPDLPNTTIGDSYYYLGFIFTLVALVSSLVTLSNSEAININSVIGSFGIALTTTIVGLVARLFITSFSIESQVRRERLDAEIELSLEKFIAQLETLTDICSNSLIKVHSTTESALNKTLQQYEEVNHNISASFQDSMRNSQKSVVNAIDDLTTRVNEIEVRKDLISKPIEAEIQQLIDTLKNHRNSYIDINKTIVGSNNLLSNQFSQSNSAIQTHIDQFENALVEVVKNQTQSYEDALSEISISILNNMGDIQDTKLDTEDSLKEKLIDLDEKINLITESFAKMSELAVDSIQDNIKLAEQNQLSAKTIGLSTIKIDTLAEQLNNSFKESDQIKSSLTDLVKVINELNKNLSEAMSMTHPAIKNKSESEINRLKKSDTLAPSRKGEDRNEGKE